MKKAVTQVTGNNVLWTYYTGHFLRERRLKSMKKLQSLTKKALQIIITVLTEFAPELIIILLCHKQLTKLTSKLQ